MIERGDPALKELVSFCDLTHTGQVVAANTFPLGASAVAAFAKQELGDDIDVAVFRYPEDYAAWLETNSPRIVCFSVFAWNMALSHEFARRIKERFPDTITVFGGVNIPNTPSDIQAFMAQWNAIDFCVEGEGEFAFVELFKELAKFDFDVAAFKANKCITRNIRYVSDGELIAPILTPRTLDMDVFPSVYANGFSDKFFDDHLIPMLETTRGCPYSCTFCHEGAAYFNKTRRFPDERVRFELDYIAERVKVPDFIITDLNFGIFPQDIETARYIADIKEKRGWPNFITLATAKNNKERVLEVSEILKGGLPPGAAVQSTDPEVLKSIKRKNLPLNAVREVAKTAEVDGAVSFSEVILCLPGDSKKSHVKSVFDVLNKGFSLIRSYQFLLLNGTEAAGKASREKHQMVTRFRVKPMNFGKYTLWGDTFGVAEVEEICVANSTMSYQDYRDCRKLSLLVEMVNNNNLFYELFRFLDQRQILRSELLSEILDSLTAGQGEISELFDQYAAEEERNLWETRDAIEEYLSKDGVIDSYISGVSGTNEVYKYRALAILEHLDALHDEVFGAARRVLSDAGKLNDLDESYLSDLREFSLMRKRSLFDTSLTDSRTFGFDYVELSKRNFVGEPFDCRVDGGIAIDVSHTPEQQQLIQGYKRQFGESLVGIGRVLNRAHIERMYRAASRA